MLLALAGLASVTTTARAQPAHPVYYPAGTFGGPGSEGALVNPHHVAVDPTNGNVLVADSGLGKVEIFQSDGYSGTYLTSIGAGVLAEPYGVAVDPSDGDVYVSDSGLGRILRFVGDGAPVPTYTVDGSFKSPTAGSGAGEVGNFAAALAVDPENGDLLVADRGNGRVSRFTKTGEPAGSLGPFTSPYDVAVGPDGTTYVSDVSEEFSREAVLRRFDEAGLPIEGALAVGPTPRALATNLSAGMVLVGGESRAGQTPRIFTFIGDESIGKTDFNAATDLLSLAVDDEPGRPAYGLTTTDGFGSGSPGVQVFGSGQAPGVSIDPPTEITSTGARVSGSVDPGGDRTIAHFELSRDGGTTWTSSPTIEVGEGEGEVPVAETAMGLQPNSSYLVRLYTKDEVSYQESTSEALAFETLHDAPAAEASGVIDRSPTAVKLGVRINPFGLATTYHVEYGPTIAYGLRAPAIGEAPAGNGDESRVFDQDVSGLAPGTAYHYRVVATSSAGTRVSPDREFTTLPEGSTLRGLELVTAGKEGALIRRTSNVQASLDGDALGYVTVGPPGTSATLGSGVLANAIATRDTDGWASQWIDPPFTNPEGIPFTVINYRSPDLSHALALSNRVLTPGAIEGGTNVYLRDNATGKLTLLAALANPALLYDYAANGTTGPVAGGSDDWSTLYLSLPAEAAGLGEGGAVFRWTATTGLQLIALESYAGSSPLNAVSADGSEILYLYLGGGNRVPTLWREGETLHPSEPQGTGGESTPVPAGDSVLSRDGSTLYFIAANQPPLTPDAPAGAEVLYRYDVGDGTLHYLAEGVSRLFSTSDDGNSVLFQQNQSVAMAVGETVRPIANLKGNAAINPQLSPNGRYAAFAAYTLGVAGYDNGGCAPVSENTFSTVCTEVYRYDAQDQTLVCASCRADGAPPSGNARVGSTGNEVSGNASRVVDDAGDVFFDTPDPLVAGDVNGVRDVYAYRDGRQTLLSSGVAEQQAGFADSGGGGRDVFFSTSARLLPADRDDLSDIYDARVGGGFAETAPPASTPPCEGEVCLGGAAATPARPANGSASLRGGGNLRRGRSLTVTVRRRIVGASTMLKLRLPEPGRIGVSGREIRGVGRSAGRAGRYSLPVRLDAAASRKLMQDGHLTTVVGVRFEPRSGPSQTRRLRIQFVTKGGTR